MSRLLKVELRRFFARRITRWSCVALLVGVIAVGIGTFASTSNDVAGAHRAAQRHFQEFKDSQAAALKDCAAHVAPDQVEQQCGVASLPPGASFYVDPRFSFHDHVRDGADAGRTVGQLAGIRARGVQQVGQRAVFRILSHGQHERIKADG